MQGFHAAISIYNIYQIAASLEDVAQNADLYIANQDANTQT